MEGKQSYRRHFMIFFKTPTSISILPTHLMNFFFFGEWIAFLAIWYSPRRMKTSLLIPQFFCLIFIISWRTTISPSWWMPGSGYEHYFHFYFESLALFITITSLNNFIIIIYVAHVGHEPTNMDLPLWLCYIFPASYTDQENAAMSTPSLQQLFTYLLGFLLMGDKF